MEVRFPPGYDDAIALLSGTGEDGWTEGQREPGRTPPFSASIFISSFSVRWHHFSSAPTPPSESSSTILGPNNQSVRKRQVKIGAFKDTQSWVKFVLFELGVSLFSKLKKKKMDFNTNLALNC